MGWDKKVFAERLKSLRKDQSVPLEMISKQIGSSISSISDWENGKKLPLVDKLFKLAKFFNVSTDYLVGLKEYYEN